MIFYGHVRVTGDVDIYFERTDPNASNLLAALQEFWNGDAPGVSGPEDLLPEGLVLQYGVPPNRIDFINTVEGITFREAWDGRVDAQMIVRDDTITVPIIGIEALITNKQTVGRPQDLTDLAFLRRVANRW